MIIGMRIHPKKTAQLKINPIGPHAATNSTHNRIPLFVLSLSIERIVHTNFPYGNVTWLPIFNSVVVDRAVH